MKSLTLLLTCVLLVNGSPLKPTPSAATTDKLESFPWIKASKAKARFGTTPPPPPCTQAPPSPVPVAEVPVSSPQQAQPQFTQEQLQEYLAAITAQLQPFVVDNNVAPAQPQPEPAPVETPPWKKPSKGKTAKLKVRDIPDATATTEAYWMAEKKIYPDSLYDEFYLDWLRKRQIEEIPVATPNPLDELTQEENVNEPSFASPQPPQQQPPVQYQPYPTVPLAMNPYPFPFMYPGWTGNSTANG